MPKPAVTMPSWTAAPMGRPNIPAACCWLRIAQAGSSCAITCSAPRRTPTGLSSLGAMYSQGTEGLGRRHDFQPVDVEVRGQGSGPEYRFGYVVRCKGCRARIDLFSPFRIALETNQRKVGLHHARLDIGHPHARPLEIGAERQRELFDERLGRAIDVPAGIGVAARRRTDIDDVAAATFDRSCPAAAPALRTPVPCRWCRSWFPSRLDRTSEPD